MKQRLLVAAVGVPALLVILLALPPVARMRRVNLWCISSLTASIVGTEMQPTAPLGQPAASAASATSRAAFPVQLTAPGWGEKTMGLPALSAIIVL